MTTYYLPEDVQRVTDAWLASEAEYMTRAAAAIEEIGDENQEYVDLVLARLEHLMAEVDRRAKIARYKPILSGKVPPEKIEEIKERLPLERVIGQVLMLRKSGNRLQGHCPFHEDRHPSFFVYPDNHYFCFQCNSGGDVFSWFMQINQSNFADAVKTAALMAGVELQPSRDRKTNERSLLT